MRGLKSEDLVAIIDFLYFGEANVYQENLDSFLAVAEELQLKGLMGSAAENKGEEIYNKHTMKKKTPPQKEQSNLSTSEVQIPDLPRYVEKFEASPPLEGTVAATDYTVAADLQDLNDKIKFMMENTGKSVFASGSNREVVLCKVCSKEGKLNVIKGHIEAHHITGVSHNCNICGAVTRTRDALRQHMRQH